MSKSVAVYQYDLYGNFIREFPSITAAALETNGRVENIRSVCTKRYKTVYGFQWRYAHEIHDKSKKIGLGKYTLDEDMKYLRGTWYSICVRPFNPNDLRYEPTLEVYGKWKESFDNFYYDVIDAFEKFILENPEYKKKTQNRHHWFSRVDKNKGWVPDNTKFMTPDFCIRHKDNTHKIIKDGRTLTAQMVVEELESMGIIIETGTILKRMRENRGIMNPNEQSKYFFNGSYYSLIELSKIIGFSYDYVKSRILKHGESLETAIKSYRDFRAYSYKGKKNLTKTEYIDLLTRESGLKRTTIKYRVNAGYKESDIINKPLNTKLAKS